MNSVIPQYCVNQDPKNNCMQEMLSSHTGDSDSLRNQGMMLNDEIKNQLNYLLSFNSISLVETGKGSSAQLSGLTHIFEDENGSAILRGKQDTMGNILLMDSTEEKPLLQIDQIKDVAAPLTVKRCKIFSSSSQLGYISVHPPMISLIKYDIRDTNNKVYLTVESEHCFSSEFLVKASDGIKTIAKLKGNGGHLKLTILESENLNLIPKVSLIALLMIMGTSQANNGNSLKAV